MMHSRNYYNFVGKESVSGSVGDTFYSTALLIINQFIKQTAEGMPSAVACINSLLFNVLLLYHSA